MDWTLFKNDSPLTGGSLTSGDPFTSGNSFDFESGSGGSDVLTLPVSVGDTITLQFVKTSTFAEFVGVDLNISSLGIETSLPNVLFRGEAFSQQMEAFLGVPPLSWSVVDGQLPIGLTLSPNGSLSGIPTELGQSTFTLSVQDSTGDQAEKTFTVNVLAEGTFDLALDWSDTSNPNGVWSYNGAPGEPITTHWDDWDPTNGCCFGPAQLAWAKAQWPQAAHVPMWAKVAADTVVQADFPIGKVIMHGGEGSRPSPKAGVSWTSPFNRVVTITGGVWQVDFTASRSMEWTIYLNDTPLTSGSLTPENPHSSIAPFRFEDGSGGPSVLTQAVAVGDVITLEFKKSSTFASFVGVDLTIFSELDIVTGLSSLVRLGTLFNQQLEVVAGQPPFNWTLVEGTLPAGIGLSDDGIISGTPTELGKRTFTVQVTDEVGNLGTRTFTLEVVTILPPPDVRVHKVGTITVPGRFLDYFIALQNHGHTPVVNGQALELLFPPSNVSFVQADPKPDAALEAFIYWRIPFLAPGKTQVIQYRVSLDPSVELGSTVAGPFGFDFAREKMKDRLRRTFDKWNETPCVVGSELVGAKNFCLAAIDHCVPIGLFDCVLLANECASSLQKATAPCAVPNPSVPAPESAICQLVVPEYVAACNAAVAPLDPNEKLVTADRYILQDQLLVYPIHFENIGEVEAIDVFITDVLDPNLDDSTIEFLSPGGSYDPSTRTVRWGLLGRNLQPGETGNVLYSIKPLSGLPSGTAIRNSAEIQFEVFEPLITPEVVNIIDATAPNCTIDPLPNPMFVDNFLLSWTGFDAVGEIDSHSIFVAKDGAHFELLLDTPDTSTVFKGEQGATYHFFCVPKDTVGNVEDQDLVSEATTTIAPADSLVLDIHPGSEQNPINPESTGVIPVALYGSVVVDVSRVDPDSLTFGSARARLAHEEGPHFEDLNGDGILDLIAHLRTQETGIAAGDETACLRGAIGGSPFEACDSIHTLTGY